MLKEPLVLIGTYPEDEGRQNKGIYVYQMDPASGTLTLKREVRDILNPSYLEIHPQRKFIYAVNEVRKL